MNVIVLGSGRFGSLRSALDLVLDEFAEIQSPSPIGEQVFDMLFNTACNFDPLPPVTKNHTEVINHYSTVHLPKRWRRFTKRGKWRSSTLVKLN